MNVTPPNVVGTFLSEGADENRYTPNSNPLK